MSKKPVQLIIPNPCQQRWQDMEAGETGRFCAHCQKTVVDFTAMSDQQLVGYFLAQPKKVCGRFTAEQLHRASIAGLSVRTGSRSQHWINLIAAGLISWSTSQASPNPLFSQAQEVNTAHSLYSVDQTVEPLHPHTTNDSLGVIKGQVLSRADNKPLAGVIIQVKGTSRGTFTDKDGSFTLPIPDYQDDKLVVVAVFIGFTTQEIHVSASRNEALLVKLSEDTTLLGEVVCIPKKPSLLKKLRNRLRSTR
ncbi:hypothetical protein GCM10028805_09250 [Spirosoma harenae]